MSSWSPKTPEELAARIEAAEPEWQAYLFGGLTDVPEAAELVAEAVAAGAADVIARHETSYLTSEHIRGATLEAIDPLPGADTKVAVVTVPGAEFWRIQPGDPPEDRARVAAAEARLATLEAGPSRKATPTMPRTAIPPPQQHLVAHVVEADQVPTEVYTPSVITATPQHPPALAREPDILGQFAEELHKIGVAGERRAALLLYLAVTSRLLPRIVSVAVKGPSAGGKSFLAKQVINYFPPSAYYLLSGMSEHALVYDEAPLGHRMIVIYEAVGMAGDLQTYLVRSLLSEGHIRYVTVEKTKEGIRPKVIDRPGPTGLITTTTAVRLHPENETRMLSVTVNDSPAQTHAVLLAVAAGRELSGNVGPWHALQEWLVAGPTIVEVPYARTLAQLVPPVAVRLRRDFPSVLSLVRAHALLHRATRQVVNGVVVATVADYAAVRELVVDLVSDSAGMTVSEAVRETVKAVGDLTVAGSETSVTKLAALLHLDKASASRRVRSAIDGGYLQNLEDRRGRPYRLALGDPLPDEVTILPPADEVLRCCSDDGGGTNPETAEEPPDD
ncbi:MAG TPA: hypothetical protein VLM76_02035 [Patescibacteria group bacterium]|nr:hypothetical protein [Patescibacteria group bacterium]